MALADADSTVAAAESIGLVQEGGGRWRPHIAHTPAEVVLLHWGPEPPFDLLLFAHVIEQGVRRGAQQGLRLKWVRADTNASVPQADLCVLAQVPPTGDAEVQAASLLLVRRAVIFIGQASLWFAASAGARGHRIALHWEDAAAREGLADDVVPSPSIIETCGPWTTCSGGMAVVDLGLLLLQELAGAHVALQVMDAICLDRLREPGARQRAAAAGKLSTMVPVLADAIALMEANVEEPLQTEEIARLLSVSRRHLERLFKQHLSTVPSRYYLDIRLQRARKLLRETRHSLLQVGLMCGFSSGSHFSSTYSSVCGITPRDERQRVMGSTAP